MAGWALSGGHVLGVGELPWSASLFPLGLVQAEARSSKREREGAVEGAPPGAIFTKFRQAISADRRLHAGAPDVALYFVHWLTDLAGAEPTPLGGCEKFVIKFPLHVLNSFLQSFKFIEGIASQTETQVMEKYLKYRWADHVPSLGDAPQGAAPCAAGSFGCFDSWEMLGFPKLPNGGSICSARFGWLTGLWLPGGLSSWWSGRKVARSFIVYFMLLCMRRTVASVHLLMHPLAPVFRKILGS
ncbi:unnamed protein product [Symbiodinium natans]|uniref:Uncharacterized protein n=1 Tax=Symbiodinium natans TaxID=878477 RepID=A0A812QZX7_9DINO|nr:unnamed protein product [Symbiodinium natans]